MEKLLDESDFRDVLDALNLAVTVAEAVRDEEGRIVDFRTLYLNEQSAQLSGVPRDQQLGATWSQLAPPLLESDLFTDWQVVVEEGKESTRALELDISVLDQYRVRGTYEVAARKWRDGVIAISRDVSDRVAMERHREGRERAERFNRQIIGGLVDAQRHLDREDYPGSNRAIHETLEAAAEMILELGPSSVL